MKAALALIAIKAVAAFFTLDEDEDLSLLQIGLVVRSTPVESMDSRDVELAQPTVVQAPVADGSDPSSRNVTYDLDALNNFSNTPCSEFVFGECPTIISTSAPRRVERLRLNLDVHDAGHNPYGYNPSIVPMPARLLGAFPSGKWLAALRTGGEQCPPGVFVHDQQLVDVAVSLDRREHSIEDAFKSVDAGDLNERGAEALRHSRALHRTWLAILDENFQPVVHTSIRMRGRRSFYDDASVADARLFTKESGEILVGYTPYALQESPEALASNDTWWDHEIVALLHIEPDGAGGLLAHVDRGEARVIVECEEQQLKAPGPKKNMGFFEKQGELYAMDWVFPTSTGTLRYDPGEANDTDVVHEDYIGKLCYGWEWREALETNPWEHVNVRDPIFGSESRPAHFHNGAHLLWLPETNAFLGIGHVRRAYNKFWSRSSEYTQQFFTVSPEPPFKLQALTPEFCFAAEQDPSKCETVQLAFSLLKDGETLLVSYGIQDCEAKTIFLAVSEVLASLRPVE